VDIIVENDLPPIIPVNKHSDALFQLDSGDGAFKWEGIADAQRHGGGVINLEVPPLAIMHELPASGWIAPRCRIEQPAMTSLHAFRTRVLRSGRTSSHV
jgi:hypothetical protein